MEQGGGVRNGARGARRGAGRTARRAGSALVAAVCLALAAPVASAGAAEADGGQGAAGQQETASRRTAALRAVTGAGAVSAIAEVRDRGLARRIRRLRPGHRRAGPDGRAVPGRQHHQGVHRHHRAPAGGGGPDRPGRPGGAPPAGTAPERRGHQRARVARPHLRPLGRDQLTSRGRVTAPARPPGGVLDASARRRALHEESSMASPPRGVPDGNPTGSPRCADGPEWPRVRAGCRRRSAPRYPRRVPGGPLHRVVDGTLRLPQTRGVPQ